MDKEEALRILLKQRKVLSFEEIAAILKIEGNQLREYLEYFEREGFLIKGEIFGEPDSKVYLPIDVEDSELSGVRIIETKGKVHLVVIWKLKGEWKVANMYLGDLDKILREGLSKAISILIEKNKVMFETYK